MENKSKFSKKDVHKVKLARALQHVTGDLSQKQLTEIARKNQLKNSPITPRDVKLMTDILGPSVQGLKGKTVRKQKDVVQPDMVPVPKHIQDHHQRIILAINIMHANQKPFLIPTSRHIHYHKASVAPSMDGDIIVSTLWALYKFYRKHSFRLTEVLVDDQLAVCKHILATLHINLNCVSKDEHVPEVECLICIGEMSLQLP